MENRISYGIRDCYLNLNFPNCMGFRKLSLQEEAIGQVSVDAYQVHSELGPGLLEKIYEACLVHELREKGIVVERQINIPIKYKGIVFDEGLRLTDLRLGYLINFNVPLIKSGIRRIIL